MNGELNKIKAGFKLSLLPIALAKLLEDKGIITEEELNKAMAKTLLEVAIKQKAIKKRAKTKGGEEGGK